MGGLLWRCALRAGAGHPALPMSVAVTNAADTPLLQKLHRVRKLPDVLVCVGAELLHAIAAVANRHAAPAAPRTAHAPVASSRRRAPTASACASSTSACVATVRPGIQSSYQLQARHGPQERVYPVLACRAMWAQCQVHACMHVHRSRCCLDPSACTGPSRCSHTQIFVDISIMHA